MASDKKSFKIVSTVLVALGIGSASISMNIAAKMSPDEMDRSIVFFNKYCNATYSQIHSDESSFIPEKTRTKSENGDEVEGLLGRDNDGIKSTPIKNYGDIGEAGHYSIFCSDYSDSVPNFQFPDLADIRPIYHVYLPVKSADFLPINGTIRSLTLGGQDLEDLSRLSEITFKADYPDPDYLTHVFISDGDWDLVLPEEWNVEIQGSIPFTFRLNSNIAFKEGYRGLMDLEGAYVVFQTDDNVNAPGRMPKNSSFCRNYGQTTQVFIDPNQIPYPKKYWTEVPKHFVCNDGKERQEYKH